MSEIISAGIVPQSITANAVGCQPTTSVDDLNSTAAARQLGSLSRPQQEELAMLQSLRGALLPLTQYGPFHRAVPVF